MKDQFSAFQDASENNAKSHDPALTGRQEPAVAAPAVLDYLRPLPVDEENIYAGFWLRFVAYVIDGIILVVPAFILYEAFGYGPFGLVLVPARAFFYILAGWTLSTWLYAALMEGSSLQATVGKRAMGLRVTDMNGRRISFGKATGRHIAKTSCGMMWFIGYTRAVWSDKKQALHDTIVGCLVVRKR